MQTLIEIAHVVHDRQLAGDPLHARQLMHKLVLLRQQTQILLFSHIVLERLRLGVGGHHFLQQLDVLQRQLLQIQIVDGLGHVLDLHVELAAGDCCEKPLQKEEIIMICFI